MRSKFSPLGAGRPLKLYGKQLDAVNTIRALYASGVRRVLLVAPTGSGKTVIAGHVLASTILRGNRGVFFAHRRILIKQTYDKLILEAGIAPEHVAILMGNDPLTNAGAPIQVVSIDTFPHRDAPLAHIVIVDEAHRSLGQTYVDAINLYIQQGAFILGLTATPWRADGKGLGDIYEELVLVATPRELIRDGRLEAPRVFAPPPSARIDLSNVALIGGDYAEDALERIMNTVHLVGDIVEHWLKHAEGRATVLFAVSIRHSMACCEAFLQSGIPAAHLDGSTPQTVRDSVLEKLETGEIKVVCTCGVLSEGWHQPAVKCAILARPTKSLTLYMQQVGRILSPWGGQQPMVLDHANNTFEHGLPHADRSYVLTTSHKKKSRFQDTKSCECGAILPTNTQVCPECGHVFGGIEGKVTEDDGELVEIEDLDEDQLLERAKRLEHEWLRANHERRRKGWRPINPRYIGFVFEQRYYQPLPESYSLPVVVATPEEKERVFHLLVQEGHKKHYQPGWKYHFFRELYGHPPTEGNGLPQGWTDGVTVT